MLSKARQKKVMEKLNRAQKCSILGPQNLGSGGGPGPRAPSPGSAPAFLSLNSWHKFGVNDMFFHKRLKIDFMKKI